jgi:hypothetical protein
MMTKFHARHGLAAGALVFTAFSIFGCLSDSESVEGAATASHDNAAEDDTANYDDALLRCSTEGTRCVFDSDCCDGFVCEWWTCEYP